MSLIVRVGPDLWCGVGSSDPSQPAPGRPELGSATPLRAHVEIPERTWTPGEPSSKRHSLSSSRWQRDNGAPRGNRTPNPLILAADLSGTLAGYRFQALTRLFVPEHLSLMGVVLHPCALKGAV